MAVVSLSTPPARLWESLLADGFRLMRERLWVYLAFAAACGIVAWRVAPQLDLYGMLATHPAALVNTPPISVVLLLALAALFFILPSALRRIEPDFRMTALRVIITAVTIVAVGAITELGYACAIVPGIIATVLLSQALIGALLLARDGAGLRGMAAALGGAVARSVALTKRHFVTTLGVIAASMFILLVPFTSVLLVLVIAGVKIPPSLTLTAPLLFLTFIYFECVRYALIVRWYRRLASGLIEEPLTVSP